MPRQLPPISAILWLLMVALVGSVVPGGGATGPNDPCVRAFGPVDTGQGQSCRSYVCVARVGSSAMDHGCDLVVAPGGNSLFIEILWHPQVLVSPWAIHAHTFAMGSGMAMDCPPWSGGALQPSVPMSLAPCTLTGVGPWGVDFDFVAPPLSENHGLLKARLGPP